MKHDAELIQVAAVAVASLENERFGQTNANALVFTEDGADLVGMQAYMVTDDVITERLMQDEKWGEQIHSRVEWAMILAEEIGEWADEISVDDVIDASQFAEEMDLATEVLEALSQAGADARQWLENHDWPKRQQKIFDEEKRA